LASDARGRPASAGARGDARRCVEIASPMAGIGAPRPASARSASGSHEIANGECAAQCVVDAGLPALAGGAEVLDHVGVDGQLGVCGRQAAAADELVAMVEVGATTHQWTSANARAATKGLIAMGRIVELLSIKPTRRRQGLRKLSPDLISKARDETATQVTRI